MLLNWDSLAPVTMFKMKYYEKAAEITEIYFNISYKLSLIREERDIGCVSKRYYLTIYKH
jgi:hypothetical protein